MSDPRVISVDIESYGICERTADGKSLPSQTVFHPVRSMKQDGVAREDLVITCAITVPRHDPREPGQPWDGTLLKQLEPGPSFVLLMHEPRHRDILWKWLRHADTLIGANFVFDLLYLRAIGPKFASVLDGARHQIIDMMHLNFLHSELRPERSLKSIGPVLGTHIYENMPNRGKKKGDYQRYKDPFDPKLHHYNASDTQNTMLVVAELAKRIEHDYGAISCGSQTSSEPSSSSHSCVSSSTTLSGPPSTPRHVNGTGSIDGGTEKTSPFSLQFYSDLTWSVVRMSTAGQPMSHTLVTDYESILERKMRVAFSKAQRKFDLTIGGKGSQGSKEEAINGVLDCIDAADPDRNIRMHPLLELTPKKKKISSSIINRKLFRAHLPKTEQGRYYQEMLDVWDYYSRAEKRLGYTFNLLRYSRSDHSNTRSIMLPGPSRVPGVRFTYPSWFTVPSPFKDDAGGEGGTRQARITAKGPAAQTFPDEIIQCYQSRFPNGRILFKDLSQIELRCPALFSGEPVLVRAYTDGEDLHSLRAEELFGRENLLLKYGPDFRTNTTFRKDPRGERQTGKHTNFADLFWSSALTQQQTILRLSGKVVPLELLQDLVDRRPQLRPVLVEWQRRLVKEARQRGYIECPLIGQSRFYCGGEKYEDSEIVNQPVQSAAANILIRLQALIHKRLPPLNMRSRIIMFHQVYDSIVFDVADQRAAEECDAIFQDALHELVTVDYWARLQDIFGREIPLEYETSEIVHNHFT